MRNRSTEAPNVREIVAAGGIQRWFNCLSEFALETLGAGSRAPTARERHHLVRCKGCRQIVDELRERNLAHR